MNEEVELKPRIETVPPVSSEALRLFDESLVWDNLLPWMKVMNSPDIDSILPRFRAVGVNFVSLTVGIHDDLVATAAHLSATRAQIRRRADQLVVAGSVEAIQAARDDGRMAVGFNLQDTLPFGRDLSNVQLLYDMGVRQAVLAYNNRNFVGDGCAEPDDAGLSLFGRSLIEEMNAVGMLIDGSHSGYRTSMEAIETSGDPVIFSHSNPFAVRPHYRSIKDDQILACAARGGVVGINGVGYWVGDNDASTEAIFRCLDHTVGLAGADHVGLGFDYVYDLDNLIVWALGAPLTWPPYEGEWMVKHNYAGPEQMVELVQMMLDHGYPKDAIRGILGANWARVASSVWK